MFERFIKQKPFAGFAGFGGGGFGLAGGGAAGFPIQFTSSSSLDHALAYDTGNNKVVIAYQDGSNSDYGTAVVATITEDSISLGTPVVFESAASDQIAIAYDANSGKIVIFYEDEGNSNYGTAIVGTVSGDSISFGSPVVFHSNDTTETSAVYDSTNNKVVVAWRNDGGVDYAGTAVVGTVSGNSISFGSESQFETDRTSGMAMAFHADEGKVVIVYNDNENNFYGTAIVGNVSGTSISFGTPVVFSSADVTSYMGVAYDANTQKMVVTYWDQPASAIKSKVASVSGTSISFGSPVTFGTNNSQYTSVVYDSANQKSIVTYKDGANGNKGTSKVGTVSGSSISFSSGTVFSDTNTSYIDSVYDPDTGKVIVAYTDNGNGSKGTLTLI